MKNKKNRLWFGLPLLLVLLGLFYSYRPTGSIPEIVEKRGRIDVQQFGWSAAEIAVLRSLWIDSLPPLPADPTNAVADNPRAAALGREFFFDTRFSANGEIACATCHKPELAFTDGRARARGLSKTRRSTPTIVGTAYSPWFFWDGRSDSQWSQALSPLENSKEHGGSRMQYAHLIYKDPEYRKKYEAVFGPMPDLSDRNRFPEKAGPVDDDEPYEAWEAMSEPDQELVTRIFTNIGKAIAAYERQIMPGKARFDEYVEALIANQPAAMQKTLTPEEVAGLRLFIGKGMCISCHFGPLFTNHAFQNVATEIAPGLPKDYGRFRGVQEVIRSEFNCLGKYSDADKGDCVELKFVKKSGVDLMGAFKVPTLRNVAETAPYMHSGQMADLKHVLLHYSRAPKSALGRSHLVPVNLTAEESIQLVAFLHTLSSPFEE